MLRMSTCEVLPSSKSMRWALVHLLKQVLSKNTLKRNPLRGLPRKAQPREAKPTKAYLPHDVLCQQVQ